MIKCYKLKTPDGFECPVLFRQKKNAERWLKENPDIVKNYNPKIIKCNGEDLRRRGIKI